ncbi:MAG TPA: hypothetical protein VK675_01135, partial [Candidatus Paceibacterota bacterium]|nr:hypothetical protein [Candidatus Paceibacterota bacterium]
MVNDELISYVRQQLLVGTLREVIAKNLQSQGWTSVDVNEAFAAISPAPAAPAVPVSPSYGIAPNAAGTQTPRS